MTQDAELKAYFEEAASWDADRAAMVRARARIAWIVAGVASLCTVLSVTTLLLMMPLKTVEPFLIRVDTRTGIIDSVPAYTGAGEIDEVITRSLLTRYVLTCQRYYFALAENDYFECGSFHSASANQAWAALWSRSNPDSPLNKYGEDTHVRVQVSGITFFSTPGVARLAQVRYLTARRRGDAGPEVLTHYMATVQYEYGKPSKDLKRRQWNPLGFRVVEFKPEVEAVSAGDDLTVESAP